MKTKPRFTDDILATLHKSKIIGIRAGTQPHRFIGVWVVVVHKRVFVRSWNDKPQGWYRAFLEEPQGMIQMAGQEIRVGARRTRGDRLLDAIDLAYKAKYNTPASRTYVVGFARARRRATTTELLPWSRPGKRELVLLDGSVNPDPNSFRKSEPKTGDENALRF